MRRHRATVAGAAVAAIALVAGAAVAVHQAVRATRAERAARADAETARQVSDFLVQLFEVSDPGEAKGETVTARELLDRGADRIDRPARGRSRSFARASSRWSGNIYRRLGLFEPARPLLEDALATRERLLGPRSPSRSAACTRWRACTPTARRTTRAEAMLREALDRIARDTARTLARGAASAGDLGSVLRIRARYPEAETLQRQALESLIRRRTARATRGGSGLAQPGRHAALTPTARRRPRRRSPGARREAAALGADHPDLGTTLSSLASDAREAAAWTRRSAYARRALAHPGEGVRPRPPVRGHDAGGARQRSWASTGRLDEALALLRALLAIRERVFGAEHGRPRSC